VESGVQISVQISGLLTVFPQLGGSRTAEHHLRKRHRRDLMRSRDEVREMLARDRVMVGSWTCAGTGKHGRPSGAVMLVVNQVTEETPDLCGARSWSERWVGLFDSRSARTPYGVALAQ
jgi:hypothetical protein